MGKEPFLAAFAKEKLQGDKSYQMICILESENWSHQIFGYDLNSLSLIQQSVHWEFWLNSFRAKISFIKHFDKTSFLEADIL